ncbi:MAG: 2-amino-4-hydroxy-6-hydroxymethyldihydropteridine diphosphokinase [Balneolaceae bacterium]
MATVGIALGSNLGNRVQYLRKAAAFLESISETEIKKSSLWESEPVGGARYFFLNGFISIHTNQKPADLLKNLKNFEMKLGREKNPGRWEPRIIDLDIIFYDNLVIQTDTLIIPHPEFKQRLFVLYPLQELYPDWKDPVTKDPLTKIIDEAPEIHIEITDYNW